MDMTNPTIGQAAAIAVVGICFVFAVLVLILIIVKIFSSIFAGVKKTAKTEVPAPVAAAPAAAAAPALAKGSCGDFKLHDVEPKQAAMVMAIVADMMQTPLNELRFKSIKKVESEEK